MKRRDARFVWLVLILAVVPYIVAAEGGYDLWWQLQSGAYLLQHGVIPRTNPFAFAGASEFWINHEWLSSVVFAWLWGNIGASGLVFLRAVLLCATVYAGWVVLRSVSGSIRWSALWAALVLTPLVGWFVNLRPQSFSILFVAVLLALFERLHREKTKLVWLLVPLFLLWVNVHGGFVLGLALCAIGLCAFLLGREGERSFGAGERSESLALALLTLGVLFIQPFGAGLFQYIWRELGASHAYIPEWRAISGRQWLLVAAIGVLPMLLAVWFGCGRRRVLCFFHVLVLYLAVRHSRMLPFVALTGSCLIFAVLPYLPVRVRGLVARDEQCMLSQGWAPRILLLLLFLWALPALVRVSLSGPRLVSVGQVLPGAAVRFLASHPSGSKLILPLHWGGYALYHLWPKYQVAIDGRNVTAYRPEYVEAYNDAYIRGDAQKLLELAPGDVALLPKSKPLAAAFLAQPNWRLVYDDDTAVVLTAAAPGPQTRLEYW